MEKYQSLNEIKARRPSAVALGFFDGLHPGHTELISRTVAFAEAHGLSADVFTFREHPKNVMSGRLAVPRLLTENEKLERLSSLGVDRVYDFNFADGFHTMPPEVFAHSLLKEAFCAEAVFCGFNFHFGAEAAGDTSTLKKFGEALNFATWVIDPVYVEGRLVSSSLIRRNINDGDVESAALLLGKSYTLCGRVEEGRKLGHVFGFPTANITPDPELTLPAHGVYVTETFVNGSRHQSVTNVGVNPTVCDKNAIRIETHLLDANPELYGQNIHVSFRKMLRTEQRFETEEALTRQIAADAASARLYFEKSL